MRASKLLALLAVACTTALAVPASALDIALTNDDGWDAPGIQIMRNALLAAGHNVTLAAPLTDQSGSSMALDLGLSLTVKKEAAGQYSVALQRPARHERRARHQRAGGNRHRAGERPFA